MCAAKNTVEDEIPSDFDWITLREDMDKLSRVETAKEKFLRKINENPFVPIGCVATATALILGLRSFQKGNSRVSQLMMRFRIGAQGFTVAALIGGIYAANVGKDAIMSFTKKQE